jgi:drug/metabolite transporter (DMT)-like permease
MTRSVPRKQGDKDSFGRSPEGGAILTANWRGLSGPVLGGVIALASFACFAVMQACGKMLSPAYHPLELVFWRHLLAVILMVGYVLVRRRVYLLKTTRPVWMGLRALVGTGCLLAMFAANAVQPLAQTSILLFTSAFLTPVLAALFLKDSVGPARWGAIVVGYLGVMLIVGMPGGGVVAWGVVFGLVAAVLQSGVGISLRYLGRTEHAFTMSFYFLTFGAVVGALGLPFVGHMPTAEDVWPLGAMTLSGLLGQLAISEAYRHAPPGVVSPMGYSGLAWAVLFDIAIWGIVPGWSVWAGGGVIIASNLFLLWRENRARLAKMGEEPVL